MLSMYDQALHISIFDFRLHMLNELDRGVQTFFDMTSDIPVTEFTEEESESETELREQWETRLNFVQVNYTDDLC